MQGQQYHCPSAVGPDSVAVEAVPAAETVPAADASVLAERAAPVVAGATPGMPSVAVVQRKWGQLQVEGQIAKLLLFQGIAVVVECSPWDMSGGMVSSLGTYARGAHRRD